MNKTVKTGGFPLRRLLARIVASFAEKHVFRSQVRNQKRLTVSGFPLELFYSSPDFPAVIQRAIQLVERDERSAQVVRDHIQAVVEVKSAADLSMLAGAGMLIGVYYDQMPFVAGTELGEVALACALVQFATCRKLLLRMDDRCPTRRDTEAEKRVKRISLRAMHAFSVRADLGARYSFEIECKLKNGALS